MSVFLTLRASIFVDQSAGVDPQAGALSLGVNPSQGPDLSFSFSCQLSLPSPFFWFLSHLSSLTWGLNGFANGIADCGLHGPGVAQLVPEDGPFVSLSTYFLYSEASGPMAAWLVVSVIGMLLLPQRKVALATAATQTFPFPYLHCGFFYLSSRFSHHP